MNIQSAIEQMLERFGESVVVNNNGKRTETYAVIQPLLYKNKMYINGVSLPAGYFDGGHYLMIASAGIKIEDYRNTSVEHRNYNLKIKRAEIISSGGCDLYIWAVLTPLAPLVEDDYAQYDRVA